MSQKERTGFRGKEYSAWHRTDSIKRFVNGGAVVASRLTMIDIDGFYVEAKHPYDRLPAALVETAEYGAWLDPVEPSYNKSGRILYHLGKAANVPVFVVLYKCHAHKNPADPSVRDIEEFYVKELYPVEDKRWKVLTPEAFAKFLVWIRNDHVRVKRNGNQLPLIPDDKVRMLTDDDLERRWSTEAIAC